MNPELEELIKAYDAAIQAQGSESERLEAIYESLLAAVADRHPNLSFEALDSTIQAAGSKHRRNSPPFLPKFYDTHSTHKPCPEGI